MLAGFHYNLKQHAVHGQRLAENNGDSQLSKMNPEQLCAKFPLCPVVFYWNFSDMIWSGYNWDQLPEHTPLCVPPQELPVSGSAAF